MSVQSSVPSPPTAPRAVLLYDADCGFCRWSLAKVLAWDRRGSLRPVAIQSAEGQRLLAGMSEEEKVGSWHLVSGDGRRWSAGAAAAPLLRRLPGGRPLARAAEALPGATERGYRLLARHRGALGRLIPTRSRRRAEERIRAVVGSERAL